MIGNTKGCTGCKVLKPFSAFAKYKNGPMGLNYTCKECRSVQRRASNARHREKRIAERREWTRKNFRKQRNVHLQRTYGISVEEYDRMFAEQGGVCAICRQPESARRTTGPTKNLSVDHDHGSGVIRGLLCQKCNAGIGQLGHDAGILESAISYLQDYPAHAESIIA